MDVTGIGGASAATAAAANDRGLASLKSEDFFKILITELRQQDPLEPSKTADMISQVANIRDIELASSLNSSLGTLTSVQQKTSVSGMIGKFIQAQVDLGDNQIATVEGVVTGVRFQADGKPMLELDTGDSIPADAVTLVADSSAAGDELLGTAAEDEQADDAGAADATSKARGEQKPVPPWKRLLQSLTLG